MKIGIGMEMEIGIQIGMGMGGDGDGDGTMSMWMLTLLTELLPAYACAAAFAAAPVMGCMRMGCPWRCDGDRVEWRWDHGWMESYGDTYNDHDRQHWW